MTKKRSSKPSNEEVLRMEEALFQLWRHKKGLPLVTPDPDTGEMLYLEADFRLFYQECDQGLAPGI